MTPDIEAFAKEMKRKGIHVGMGSPSRCVNCGENWPCSTVEPKHIDLEEIAVEDMPGVVLPDPTREQEGKVGRDHPETARKAARRIRHGVATQKGQLIEALAQAGQRGLTAAEGALIIDKSRNQTATRLLELREDGWAEWARDDYLDEYIERDTGNGFTGRVHILTAQARITLNEGK